MFIGGRRRGAPTRSGEAGSARERRYSLKAASAERAAGARTASSAAAGGRPAPHSQPAAARIASSAALLSPPPPPPPPYPLPLALTLTLSTLESVTCCCITCYIQRFLHWAYKAYLRTAHYLQCPIIFHFKKLILINRDNRIIYS